MKKLFMVIAILAIAVSAYALTTMVDDTTLEEKITYKKDILLSYKAEIEARIADEKKAVDEKYAGQLKNVNDKLKLFDKE